MLTYQRCLPVVFLLAACHALEVVNLRWAHEGYFTIYEVDQTINKAELVCEVSLEAAEKDAKIEIYKNGKMIYARTGVLGLTPDPNYKVTHSPRVVSRAMAEGLYSCKVSLEDQSSEKSVLLHVAEKENDGPNQYMATMDTNNKCVYRYSETTPYSNPPVHAKCGIWQYDTPTDPQHGGWLQNRPGLKASYSSENGEWILKQDVKDPKMKRYVLENAVFKKRDLPSNKMMELRCKHYYKFGKDDTAVEFVVDTTRRKIMEDYKYRCPALDAYKRKNGVHGNVTAKFGPSTFRKNMNADLHNEYTTDCMGMWSSVQKPLEATLFCHSKNGTGHAELDSVKVVCDNMMWKEVTSTGPVAFDLEDYYQTCSTGGAAIAISSLVTLLLSSVLSLHL